MNMPLNVINMRKPEQRLKNVKSLQLSLTMSLYLNKKITLELAFKMK